MEKLDTFDMVLFGGTGDLALRKLVPALYRRHVAGQMEADSRVLAVARSGMSRDDYLAQIEASCRKHLGSEEFTEARWRSFAAQVDYVQVDATEPHDFRRLTARLSGRDNAVRVIFHRSESFYAHLRQPGFSRDRDPEVARRAGKAAGP